MQIYIMISWHLLAHGLIALYEIVNIYKYI